MLDLRFVREKLDLVRVALQNRQMASEILTKFEELDGERRRLILEIEERKAKRNQVNDEISLRKKQNQSADDLIAAVKDVSAWIKAAEPKLNEVEAEESELLKGIPNIPDASVPIGDETANQEVRVWGTKPKFDYQALNHWELGESLGILDFPRAVKISGSRFAVLNGLGATLNRALINFMVDTHVKEHGYKEIWPPSLINSQSLYATGQLPKFAEESFKIENRDLWLSPTAEVPLTNLHRDETLNGEDLPISYVAYTPCFRAEAGAAGRDTRGLIRMHQFDKVELVKFVSPETSFEALEVLTSNAEAILRKLELPYRVVLLSTGDMGFSSAKTYDLEVWLPGPGLYREISSCSCFTDFQARRAGIRLKKTRGSKTELAHTLNGSGLAIGRTLAAILENGQQPDGSVALPKALWPYLGGLEAIKRPS
ncbi:MAG: serine--tRNA ligase [Deltaproteobacteria bacterium]|jgi:seryl-tRNA synthetase|nr:serine--tRNA ligase [Deltaproteobacteria bacterium]